MSRLTYREETQFLDRIRQDPSSDCWLWCGAKAKGYPFFQGCSKAYHISYQVFKGPIPRGLVIDHLCCQKMCVNPSHLEAVTHGENSRRGNRPHLPVNGDTPKQPSR